MASGIPDGEVSDGCQTPIRHLGDSQQTQLVVVDRRRDSSNGWIADSKGVRWVSDTHLTPKHSPCRKDRVEQQTEGRVGLTAMLDRKSEQHHVTGAHCGLHDC